MPLDTTVRRECLLHEGCFRIRDYFYLRFVKDQKVTCTRDVQKVLATTSQKRSNVFETRCQETRVDCCLVYSQETEHTLRSLRQIQADLNQILCGHCPSHRTVARWVLSFKNGSHLKIIHKLDVLPRHGPKKTLLLSDKGSTEIHNDCCY